MKETSGDSEVVKLHNDDLYYIYRYIIEYTILNPPKLDVDENDFFYDNINNLYILNSLEATNFEYLDWYKEFFKNKTTLISQISSYDQLIVFNKFKPYSIKTTSSYKRLNRKNSILFSIGRIDKVEGRYFIVLLYVNKYNNIDDYYSMARIFEFEICGNGFINFKNCYDPIGNFGDEQEYLFDKISLSSVKCN